MTPDGVLSEMRKVSNDDVRWGVTWPVLENDGRPLMVRRGPAITSTGYAVDGDRENFIALNENPGVDYSDQPLRSTYGDLRPVRVTVGEAVNRSFLYPANAGQPSAETVRQSFRRDGSGF